jgi:hypothetical protein
MGAKLQEQQERHPGERNRALNPSGFFVVHMEYTPVIVLAPL